MDTYVFRRINIAPDEVEFEYVTQRHAALLASVSELTIRNLIKTGQLEARRLAFSNMVLVTRDSLEKYVKGRSKS